MRRAAATAIVLAIAAAAVDAQAPLEAVLTRAGDYVERYQREFSMVVSEERYEQEVRYPASPLGRRAPDLTQTTLLRSDFLLVRNADGGWLPFRDVFERDGMPVRDRDERLSRLFLSDPGSAARQARRIADESTRYNVGAIDRNINLPTLPLIFLTRARAFAFTDDGRDGGLRVIRFREEQRPTYVSTTAGRDLPVAGRFWIDEASGRVERTELTAANDALEARISVTYRPDAAAGLWVPSRMDEFYVQRADRSEIRGSATYSRFRRFQISTTEDVAK
jgi:hypothetical protein